MSISLICILVLRSQSRLIRMNPIRQCCVLIEPNFHVLSLQWLNRTNLLRPAIHNNQAGPSNAQNPPAPPVRRFSVASCRNLFEVDGTVEETGYDFLNHVSRPQRIEIDRGEHHYIVKHGSIL